ncbi:efflux RND transporter periplasmic adaptor subunit [Rheinheimera fenheensis]|uniref:efflux RND transporter periplasmic adaptor subunit n=1 Tax=Rheinheimera fenheensis TaxID=3152295 RepID=UPI00325CACCA
MSKFALIIAAFFSNIAISESLSLTSVEITEAKASHEVPTTDVPGEILSTNNVVLTAGVDGRLTWILEPGTDVKAGELIAQVDPLPLQLKKAEINAHIQRAQLKADYFKKEHLRLQTLHQNQSISLLQLDKAKSDHELALADANIMTAQLAQLDDQLERTQIKAPFSGILAERIQQAGRDISKNSPIARLQDTHQLTVHAYVPLKYLRFIRLGDYLSVSNTKQSSKVAISAVIPASNGQSQRAEIRLKLIEDSKYWLAGELVNVKIPVRDPRTAVIVPRDALLLRASGIYVVTVDENNIAQRKLVKVSEGEGEWVTIDEGLNVGEKVVTRGAERLTQGQIISKS